MENTEKSPVSSNTQPKLYYPKQGHVYSLEWIMKRLDMRDGPNLAFYHEKRRGVIQDSHLSLDEFLSVPGIGDTQWRYIRETHEWIPCFEYVGDISALLATIDIKPLEDRDFPDRNKHCWWATPKGFPRKQYED